MSTSQTLQLDGMGCVHYATCSFRRPESVKNDNSDIESVLSPSLSQGNYDREIWSLSRSISTMNSSDLVIDDNILSGVGLSVGKLMFAIGKVELRAVEWLWIRYRQIVIRRLLSRRIRHFTRGTERMLDDLIAFSGDAEDISGWRLRIWPRDILFNQIRLGLGHEVARAVLRAPATLGLCALNNIYARMHYFMRLEADAEQLVDVMAPVTNGWFGYSNKFDSLTSHISQDAVSRLFTYAIMFGLDEQHSKHMLGSVRIDLYTLYWVSIGLSPTGKIATQILRVSEYLQGGDDPHHIALKYLISGNQLRDEPYDDVLHQRALFTCLWLLQPYSYAPQAESGDLSFAALMTEIIWNLENQERWVEAEVFCRFYIAVEAHSYQVPYRACHIWSAFQSLGNYLRRQGFHSEADQCDEFLEPLRVIYHSSSPNSRTRKINTLSRICSLCGLRWSRDAHVLNERIASSEDWLEQLWAEFNPQNDAFLRKIAVQLDEEMQERLGELTEAERSSGDDDFYTAHACPSDCEHD